MKKLLALVLMAAVLVCPVFASGAPADEAQPPHYVIEVVEPATADANGVSAYVNSETGDVLFTFETPALAAAEAAAPAGGVAPQHYTYQYDAVLNEDGSFSDFGTWVGDEDGAVVPATEANAVYFYALTEDEAAPAEVPSGEPTEEPAAIEEPAEEPAEDAEKAIEEAPAEEAAPAEEEAAEEAPAEEEAPAGEAPAEEEAPAEAMGPANPDYDAASKSYSGTLWTLVLVTLVLGYLLMSSFNSKKKKK